MIDKTNLVDGSPQTVTIAESGTTSGAIFVGDMEAGSFKLPTFTGTALTIHGSADGTNFAAIRDNDNAAISAITVTSNGTYVLPAEAFRYGWLKFVSGSSEAAARTISVFLKG